jgi:hypothetical protein
MSGSKGFSGTPLSRKLGADQGAGVVQSIGLAAGLVDNKSCAIDESWQALRFVWRLEDRPRVGSAR